jgi:hypothetical protein
VGALIYQFIGEFQMKTVIWFFLLFVIASNTAHAYVDGYYCSSDKFLAYEFSYSQLSDKQHRLFVIPFRSPLIASPVSLPIPDFQVSEMKCTDTKIEIIGLEKKYTFNFVNDKLTSGLEEKLSTPGVWSQKVISLGFPNHVTGQMLKVFLSKDESGNNYELQMEQRTTRDSCEFTFITALVVMDQRNKIKESKTIFYRDKVPIDCGE